jgi:hypothetical protein
VPGPGRPAKAAARRDEACAGSALCDQVLRYRLAHPGAVVPHPGGSTSYSDRLERFILDQADGWAANLERFCAQAEVPCLYGIRARGGVQQAIFPDDVADLACISHQGSSRDGSRVWHGWLSRPRAAQA